MCPMFTNEEDERECSFSMNLNMSMMTKIVNISDFLLWIDIPYYSIIPYYSKIPLVLTLHT